MSLRTVDRGAEFSNAMKRSSSKVQLYLFNALTKNPDRNLDPGF
jgi:hypothetical protein